MFVRTFDGDLTAYGSECFSMENGRSRRVAGPGNEEREMARGDFGFGTSKADLQSPLWDWLYTTAIPVLVSTGNCHLLGATSFVPLLLSSHTLTLTLSLPAYAICPFPSSKRTLFRSDPRKAPIRARAFSKALHCRKLETSSRPTNSSIYLRTIATTFFLLSSPSHPNPPYIHVPLVAKNCAIEKSERHSWRSMFIRECRSINADILGEVFDLSEEC